MMLVIQEIVLLQVTILRLLFIACKVILVSYCRYDINNSVDINQTIDFTINGFHCFFASLRIISINRKCCSRLEQTEKSKRM